MPLKNGRLTVKERKFIKAMNAPPNPIAAAAAAGFKQPQSAAWKLMSNPVVSEATREDARRFVLDKAGSIGVYVLATIALDEKQPGGARVSASKELAKLSGIAVGDGESGKEPHEMDASELHAHRARLEQQRNAIDRALADKARPIVDAEPVSTIDEIDPDPGAFE